MSKRSLLNIEASFGKTNGDIAALRAQVREGDALDPGGIDKNANLIKLEPSETNEALMQVFTEIKEQIEEDFDFIVQLCEADAAFGREIKPGESELLGSMAGADIVTLVALNSEGELASKLVMDFGPFIPDTLGSLKTNDFITFPAWVPYGYTRNRSSESLYMIEMYMRIIGTKTEQQEFEEKMKDQGAPEPILQTTDILTSPDDIPMDNIIAKEVTDPEELAYAASLRTDTPEETKDED